MSDLNFTTTDNLVEEIALIGASSMSFVACMIIIVIYIIIFEKNNAFHKFVIALAFSDLLFSLCKQYLAFIFRLFYNVEESSTICDIQGAMQQFSFNSSTFIIFFISLYLYLNTKGIGDQFNSYANIYIEISMLIPAMVSLWFILSDEIRKAGPWCFPYLEGYYWQVKIIVF